MQISSRRLLLEAGVATAIVLVGVAVAVPAPHLGWGTLRPHPVWLVVLALSARYGARGLVVSVPVAWGSLVLLAEPWRAAPTEALAALATPAELGALAAAIMISWIASVHERRTNDLEERLAILAGRASHDATALGEVRRAALALRARNDRLDLALTFLRDVARRIDGGDVGAASEAALTLVVARLGARAGAVQARTNDASLILVASIGAWDVAATPAGHDATVVEALKSAQPIRAIDLPGAGPSDSDLAAPIIVGRETVGVMAVRGVARVGAAALRDLEVVAEWLGTAFARARARRVIERGDRANGSVVNV
ncbi:MAG TPA: hypothetical protein VH853_06840 [Polyangia bacterium]|jgi:hypothetical protein|nr:hypothetical protein [Polyangia bacterium]